MEYTSGDTLRLEREHAELTQAEVAARMGVRRESVNRAEGKARVKPAYARRYRAAISGIATEPPGQVA